MFQFLSRMFNFVEAAPASYGDCHVDTAIEAVVDGTDPRLRLLSGYKETLRPAVETAIGFVWNLVANLGSPCELTRAGFVADPRIHLLFGSADWVQNVISRDDNVRAFLAAPGNAGVTEFYAVLTARRREKRTLGMRLVGNVIENDVPLTVMEFRQHSIVAVSPSFEDTLLLAKRSAFRQLVHFALKRITHLKSHGSERGSHILRERMEALDSLHAGNEHPFWPGKSCKGEDEAGTRLSDLDRKLAECDEPPCSLEDFLPVVADVLSHPERYISQSLYSATVDRMGLPQPDSAAGSPGVDRVVLPEVRMPDTPDPMVTLPVRMLRSEVIAFSGLRYDTPL